MPRLITRSSRVERRAPVEDERNVEPGTVVQFPNASQPDYPVQGVVAGQYWDDEAHAYLCIVDTDVLFSHAVVGDLSRVVVHPAQLTVARFTYSETTEEAPPCSDCGEDSHGEGLARGVGEQLALHAFCDECAIDMDVDIQPWAFVVDAQVGAEDETAEYVGGGRARQNEERVRGIRDQIHQALDELMPRRLDIQGDQGLCGNHSSHGQCNRMEGHDGYHHVSIGGPQWEDDGTTVTAETWRPLPVSNVVLTSTGNTSNAIQYTGGQVFYRPLTGTSTQ